MRLYARFNCELNRAVFLDRDGVVNRSLRVDGRPIAPRRYAEFRLAPGAVRLIPLLKREGFTIIVITNQPDVAKGLISMPELDRMNNRVLAIGVDAVKICMHSQDAACHCRKPAPGMILEAASEFCIDTRTSYLVGDRWSDIEAGHSAGCYTIKIERHWANERPSCPDAVVKSLSSAVRHILSMERSNAYQ